MPFSLFDFLIVVKSTSFWHICCVFVSLKVLGSLQYRESAANFFKKIEIV